VAAGRAYGQNCSRVPVKVLSTLVGTSTPLNKGVINVKFGRFSVLDIRRGWRHRTQWNSQSFQLHVFQCATSIIDRYAWLHTFGKYLMESLSSASIVGRQGTGLPKIWSGGHTNINVPLKVCACYVQLCLWYCGIIDFSSESDSLSNTEWGPYYQTGSPVSELKNKKIYILQQSATQNFSINNFSFCWTARHGDVLAVTIQILCWCRHCLCHAL